MRSAPPSRRRGVVSVAVLILLGVLMLVVAGVVMAGGRDHEVAGLELQGERARYAADAAAHMAVKELFDNLDRDGDGGIGTISADGNTANDPTLGATRLWATAVTAGSETTVTARGENAAARRAVQVRVVGAGTGSGAATILLVVVNSASLLPEELARKSLFESWGYTVTTISESASQASFDTAWRAASVAYIVETCLSANVGTKLTAATLGVITEEAALSDELGFSSSMTTISTNQVETLATGHDITAGLGVGTVTVFSSSQPVRWLSGTQGGYTALAQQVGTANVMLAVMERGTALTPSGAAAGRRVFLPFGNTGFDLASLTDAGRTLLRRSIEWCLKPVGHWKLDDASGSTALDSAGSFHGALSGPVWTTGRLGGALQFDGIDDFVSTPNTSAFQVTTALTMTGWIRGTSWRYGSSTCPVLRKGTNNPNNWQLAVNDGKVTLQLDANDNGGFRAGTTLNLGVWYHVAATWDGATVRLYLNGVSDMAPASRTTAIGVDTRPVYLGGRPGATDYVHGALDDVRFYNRALTPGEIVRLMQDGKRIDRWAAVAP